MGDIVGRLQLTVTTPELPVYPLLSIEEIIQFGEDST